MKTIEQIYQDMMESFETETGFRMSGAGEMALRFRAVAAQVHALYVQLDWTVRQCFPQTAEGEYLDHFAQLRALQRREAAKAVGVVRFQLEQSRAWDVEIPAATVCISGGLVRFLTDTAAVIPAGSLYADVPVTAAEAGSQGNVGAGDVTAMAVPPTGVSSCTNPQAFGGGADREDDESLRLRVLDSYSTLPNGANTAYYRSRAMDQTGVAAVCVKPKNRGLGTVDVVISAPEGVPSTALLGQVQQVLEQEREIAVDVLVKAPETVSVTVALQIRAAEGYSYEEVAAAVQTAVEDYFSGTLLGQDVTLARLGALIYGVPGVENYRVTLPTGDVTVAEDQLPVLASAAVTEMES